MCDANKPTACEGTPAPCSGQRNKSVSSRGGRAPSAQPPCTGSAPMTACLGANANPIKLDSMSGGSSTKKSPVKECNGDNRKSPAKQECTGGAAQKSPVKQECTGAAAKPACTGGSTAKEECNGNAPPKQQCTGAGKATTKKKKSTAAVVKKESTGVKVKRVVKPASAEPGKVIKRGAARGLCVPVNGFCPRSNRTRAAPVRFGVDDQVDGLAVAKVKAKAKSQGKKAVGKKAKKAKKA